MNKTNYPILFVIAFFVLTLFVFGPGTIYFTNSLEFTNSYFDLLLVGICFSLVFALVFWLIFLGLWSIGPRVLEKGLAILFASTFLIWFQGNFLLWKYGPLDGRYIDWSLLKWHGYIDGGIWIGLLAAAFIFSPFVIRIAKKICLIFILFQLGYGMVLFFKQPEMPSFQQYSVDATNKFVFSKNKNVIIIIFDSFQTDVFNEIILGNPGMAKSLDGFTYFRNALGGYPATELSVALMLTGKFYDNSMPFEQWKRDAYMSQSIPHVLKSAGWQVDIYPKVSYSLFYSDAIASNFVKSVPFSEKMIDIFQIYDLTIFRCLPHFFKPFVYNDQAWLLKRFGRKILGKKVKIHKTHTTRVTGATIKKNRNNHLSFPKDAFKYNLDIQFITHMLLESSTADSKGTFKFYHLGMPHIPLTLNEKFKYKKMAVNRKNYKKYATAAVKLMIIFLQHLQEMGIYDDSLVIILGDHGAGGQGQHFVVQPGMPTKPGTQVVTDRSRISSMPLVLFKPIASRGELKISNAPISLGDVPATVFSDLGLSIKAPGIPMQGLADSAIRERRFMIYGTRDVFSYYGDMTEYIVSGYGWFDESWLLSGKVFTPNGVVTSPR